MNLPKFTELSQEQLDICQAPLGGTTIVAGPPGSGKTVVALFRQESAERLDVDCQLVVYNQVLKAYTGIDRTFYSWLASWWRTINRGRRYPRMDGEQGSWRLPDFERMTGILLGLDRDSVTRRGHWGHLILDEAQDFGTDAHSFLANVPLLAFAGDDAQERPSLTVLADDNQRITEHNATISEIAAAHRVAMDDLFYLRKNYRNTAEIARAAAHFYVGAKTGIPDLPDRRGNKPTLTITANLNEAVERIASHARSHPEQEIGVLVQYNRLRRKFFNRLHHRLAESNLRVQTYDRAEGTSGLTFDEPGTISVLTFASSKGLEFDAVFLPELQDVNFSGGSADGARMTLYVMCARARDALSLMISGDPRHEAEVWQYLPSEPELSTLFDVSR